MWRHPMIDCPECGNALKPYARSCRCGWKETAKTDAPARHYVACAHDSCPACAIVRVGNANLCYAHYEAHHAKKANARAESLGLQKFPEETSREYVARSLEYMRQCVSGMGRFRWKPENVVNDSQVRHILESAQRGYPAGVAFLEQCKRAGVITEDNKLAKRERIAA